MAVTVARLQEWRTGVETKLDLLDAKIELVLVQTTKTNGTVAELKAAELERAAVRGFQVRCVKVALAAATLGAALYGAFHL